VGRRYPGFLLESEPPPRWAGVVSAALAVALCTLLIFPLKRIAPAVSFGVLYMLAVLAISVTWGSALGAMTAVASALAFNFFHIPPVGHLAIRDSRDWVALVAFLIAAALASSVAEVARARAREAEERRREADLAADTARLLLRGGRLDETLPTVAARLAESLELPWAAIELAPAASGAQRVAFPLREGGEQVGTLLVPTSTSEAARRRIAERVAPALEALLSAARERERLLGEVVETSALRRADVVKTALLRAVSHDLRSPLTAIRAAGESVALPALSAAEREELASVVQEESRRLSRLVDNLLDLSRLEAGAAEPRREWISLDEIIRVAVTEMGGRPDDFALSIPPDLPLIQADGVQLERALVNVLENARRHAGGSPVAVRARVGNGRLRVRVVDRGPGIAPAQTQRVFEPFYRSGDGTSDHRGSGLGLAIARGFVEANGGTLHVESTPGQGASFVFSLPLSLDPTPAAEPSAGRPSGVAT
jgi:two-component system sensor histidine kinase KdpD